MSDDMKLTIEVDTKTDPSALRKISKEVRDLEDGIGKLKGKLASFSTGATKGLEKSLADSAKNYKKFVGSLAPSDEMIKKFRKMAESGKLTSQEIGKLTGKINKMNREIGETEKPIARQTAAWKKTFLQATAVVQVVEEMKKKRAALVSEIGGRELKLGEALVRASDKLKLAEDRRAASAEKAATSRRRAITAEGNLQHKQNVEQRVAHDKVNQNLKRQNELLSQRDRRYDSFRGAVLRASGVAAKETAVLQSRGAIEKRLNSAAIQAFRDKASAASRLYRTQRNQLLSAETFDKRADERNKRAFDRKMQSANIELRTALAVGRAQEANFRAQERAAERQKQLAISSFSRAQSHGANLYNAARQPAYYGMAAAGAAGAVAYRGIRGRIETDSAETKLRMFGSEPGEPVTQADVKAMRKSWINRAAIDNGLAPASVISSYTNVLKAGIDKKIAKDVTLDILQATKAIELPIKETTDLAGTLATNMPFASPEEKRKQIGETITGMALAARETRADSSELVSAMNRSAGVSQSTQMSGRERASFLAAGISGGMQEGKAGTFLDFLVGDITGYKKLDKHRRQQLTQGLRMSGMGNIGAFAQRLASGDSANALNDLFSAVQNEEDPKRRGEIASLIGMREWRGEFLLQAGANKQYQRALNVVRDPAQQGFLRQGRDEVMGSWQGMLDSMMSVASLAWESLGEGFEGLFRSVTGYFTDIGREFDFDSITRNVQGFVDGLRQGLFGDRTWRQVLEGIFGRPGEIRLDFVQDLFKFGKGFASGIKAIASGVASLFSVFAGSRDPEAIGNLAGKIVALSGALVILSPVVATLGALASGVLAIATAMRGFGALATLLGGGTSGILSKIGLAGLASRLITGLGLGLVALIGTYRGEIVTMMIEGYKSNLQAMKDALTAFWDELKVFIRKKLTLKNIGETLDKELLPDGFKADKDGIEDRLNREQGGESGFESFRKWLFGTSHESHSAIEQNNIRLASLTEAIQDVAGGNGGEGFGSLIQKASFTTSDNKDLRDLKQIFSAQGARLQLAALTGGSGGGLGSSASGGGGGGGGSGSSGSGGYAGDLIGNRPGSALPGGGLGRRGIIGGGGGSSGTSIAEAFRNRLQRGPDGSVIAGGGKLKNLPNRGRPTDGGDNGGGVKSGGSLAWRNNNPGNIRYGAFARSMGAIGQEGGFSKFPDYATGRKAQESLLFESKGYRGLTIGQAIHRWAPSSDGNDPKGYAARLARAAGVSTDTPLSSLTPEQRGKLLDAQQQQEGWKVGTVRGGGGTAGAPGAASTSGVGPGPDGTRDISGGARFFDGKRSGTDGFIFHHTAGRGSAQGVMDTLNQRRLSVHYVMDRDGNVYKTLPDGAQGRHMLDGNMRGSKDRSLSNRNTMGMEVIAKDDSDITPAQVASAQRFMQQMRQKYPNIKVYGHGEVNPGHKLPSEGMTITNAVRKDFAASPAPSGGGSSVGNIGKAIQDTAAGARASSAADNAGKLIGASSSQAAAALGSKMTPGEWCADFVNGALKSANLKGVNSSIANSFMNWGREVTDGVKKGDVLVEHRGRGPGAMGGHAGIATGESRINGRGHLEYKMISGNYGNRVKEHWESAARVIARRSLENDDPAAPAAVAAKSLGLGAGAKDATGLSDQGGGSGWKPGWGGNAIRRGRVLSPEELAAGAVKNGPRAGNAAGGQGGNSSSIHAPITINGAGGDPETLANRVQKRIQDASLSRKHDWDFQSV